MSSSSALVKRPRSDMALMPPPPTKRIKRPATVLDEDEYTEALSNIIARDYFPGVAELKAQDEYLSALESENPSWIAEAGSSLRNVAKSAAKGRSQQTVRNTTFDTPRSWHTRTPVADTPRSDTGAATPVAGMVASKADHDNQKQAVDTSDISLSDFQAKYTSEDNESFNTVLDKQNTKRRQKYAHLWTSDQSIPSDRLLTYRANQAQLAIQQKSDNDTASTEGRELVPITVGAISSRPAQPDSWRQKKPDNTFMFNASSVDEDGMQTVMDVKQAQSKVGPRQTVYANTRFPPLSVIHDYESDNRGSIPPSPSLNTSIINRREAAGSGSTFAGSGGDTPRVNGYAFVDEDEPENLTTAVPDGPTYRDLLAGQAGSSTTPNPFTIHEKSKREDLHHRLVDKEKAKRRAKERETIPEHHIAGSGPTPGSSTPGASLGNMTPAARKLMEKLGRTPVANPLRQGEKAGRMSSLEMWTPVGGRGVGNNTPRQR